ncbi:MAG: GNAT family N-acetyltransferase [Oscillospiraceae bacterium]|nr:GNAT family N-acetyltransferase [Oscillospiraceae bacterium]
MIRQLTDDRTVNKEWLAVCHYGRKMLTCLAAYGTNYDFCRFFELESGGKHAWMMLQNSTLIISAVDDFFHDRAAHEELHYFVQMHRPFRVEGCQNLVSRILPAGYMPLRRSVFRLVPGQLSAQFDPGLVNDNPRLDDVYDILTEGFPNLTEHGLWLTDTSHMVRRGLRRCYTYDNITAATAVYDYCNRVLIGQVATRAAYRGQGYARDLLRYLAAEMEQQGKVAILYALDLRAGFYQEIGFTLLQTEQVLERLENAEPDALKKEAL